MDIRKSKAVKAEPVSEAGAQGVSVRWLVGPDSGAPNFHMRQFEVVPGGHTPRHRHAWEHECYILEGQARLFSADKDERTVRAGDVVYVPGGEEHQFTNDGWGKLVFLCMVPAQQCNTCKG